MQIEVVDDHSTADDPEEGRAARRGRVAFHRQPENVGVVGNLNTCLNGRAASSHLLHGDDSCSRASTGRSTTTCEHSLMPARLTVATRRRARRRLDVAPLEPASSGTLRKGRASSQPSSGS